MSTSPCKGWFLDLQNTCDEVLLLFAREAQSQPARSELTCRCWQGFKASLHYCDNHELTAWDIEDAQQQSFFWIQEAIASFDPHQLCHPRGSSFRTFLKRVIRLRVADFARSLRRSRKRFHAVGEVEHSLEDVLPRSRIASLGSNENLDLELEFALRHMDPLGRALWNEVRQGKRLCDLPQVLGISYRTVKRRWRSLRSQLHLFTQRRQETALIPRVS
jgi:DNA-directed RNA polymerase specialized sigma24 family protein